MTNEETRLKSRIHAEMITAIKRLNQYNIYRELAKLNSEINACEKCNLSKYIGKPVVGEGPVHARIFFVGESPSSYSDLYGRPFVGEAGDVLDKWFEVLDLPRDYVYLTNIVKCKKGGARVELPWDIVKACGEWLNREIELIKPKLIVTLGAPALRRLYPGSGGTLEQAHGRYETKDDVTYFAMWHPSFIAYGLPKSYGEIVKQDLSNLKRLLNSIF